jgi:hypothetical protein
VTEYYPGSNMPVGSRPEPQLADWGKPTIYNVGGVPTEFYMVGQLAAALSRSPVTIRKWERNGWIPIADFRTPAVTRNKTRRLYTRYQLETIVRLAYEEGLMDFTVDERGRPHPKKQVADTKFAERVRSALAKS